MYVCGCGFTLSRSRTMNDLSSPPAVIKFRESKSDGHWRGISQKNRLDLCSGQWNTKALDLHLLPNKRI
jgi:hypothetical protein